jgi:Transposase DDE domain
MPTNQQVNAFFRRFLQTLYENRRFPPALIETLALLLTGVFLGRHVQLWELALWSPQPVQLTSIVRRFERFLADPRVEVRRWFEPFVWLMHRTLGCAVAYVIIDCTQAGSHCRTLTAGLAYHGTILPLAWQTHKGKKGHLKGVLQKALLQSLVPLLRRYTQIIVLGDGEFSNETVIRWLRHQGWDFVFRFRASCLLQVTPTGEWQSAHALAQACALQPGQLYHWEGVCFTQRHRLTNLTITLQWGAADAQPLYLVSTLPAAAAPHRLYEQRYWIETFFASLKARGFHLARTHLTLPEQIDRLFLVVAIAACLVLGLASYRILTQQTQEVDRSDRRDLSLFQLGFRSFFRLLALNRLHEFALLFSWSFRLPQPGFQRSR